MPSKSKLLFEKLRSCGTDQVKLDKVVGEHIADIPRNDQEGNNIFHYAAQAGDASLLNCLIQSVIRCLDHDQTHALLRAPNQRKQTPLHFAAAFGHDDIIRCLVEWIGKTDRMEMWRGCINARDANGDTPLCLAAHYGRMSTVELLLTDYRADVKPGEIFDEPGEKNTSVHHAASQGHTDIIRALVERSPMLVNVKNRPGKTPLYLACIGGYVDTVKYLLEEDYRINHRHPRGPYDFFCNTTQPLKPLLLEAAKHGPSTGHVAVVRLLLARGAEINSTDLEGNTALHHAAKRQDHELIRELLTLGADDRKPNFTQETPLLFLKDRRWLKGEMTRLGHIPKNEVEIPLDSIQEPHYELMLICIMSSHRETRYFKALQPPDQAKQEERQDHLTRRGWKPLKTSEDLGIGQSEGYFGVAHYRVISGSNGCEVVMAHRGTCFELRGNVQADIAIMKREVPPILEQACTYITALFKHDFYRAADSHSLLKIGEHPVIKMTHTGFSLGGFIASVCTGLAQSSIVHAVTFDAPGCDYLVPNTPEIRGRMINYVATPNLVNTLNVHRGEIRRLAVFPEYCGREGDFPREEITEGDLTRGLRLELNVYAFLQLLATRESHDLDKLITKVQNMHLLRYERVLEWPRAIAEAIDGNEPPPLKVPLPYPGFGSFGAGVVSILSGGTYVAGNIVIMKKWYELVANPLAPGEWKGVVAIKYQKTGRIVYYGEQQEKETHAPAPAAVMLIQAAPQPAPAAEPSPATSSAIVTSTQTQPFESSTVVVQAQLEEARRRSGQEAIGSGSRTALQVAQNQTTDRAIEAVLQSTNPSTPPTSVAKEPAAATSTDLPKPE